MMSKVIEVNVKGNFTLGQGESDWQVGSHQRQVVFFMFYFASHLCRYDCDFYRL